MATDQPNLDRPFNHSIYDNMKLQNLDGDVYKFSVIFPISDGGGNGFSASQRAELVTLLTCDFCNCSIANGITHPLLPGTNIPDNCNILKVKYSQISVYTSQSDYAFKYFKELQKNLQKISGEHSILIEILLFHSPNVIKSLKKRI